MTVNCLYDEAFYYTKDELRQKTGDDIDVDALIQKPNVYILARCSDKLIDQLCYVNNRVEDLTDLKDPVISTRNAPVTDIMRFFHGDHPAQAVEAGQQEGGNYPCCFCNKRVSAWTDMVSCYRADNISLQQRIVKVI